jgi:hypothetical protein
MFHPVVQFTPAQGAPVEFRSDEGSSPPSFHTGEKVTVYYDPQTPQNARLKSFWSSYAGLIFVLFGLLAVVLGVFGTPGRSAST